MMERNHLDGKTFPPFELFHLSHFSNTSCPRSYYTFAKTAAPPNKAPIATAPVFIGAAFGLVVLAARAELEAELMREAIELLMDDIAEVIELLSASVAVERTDEKEEMRLEASLVRELTKEEASERMDESAGVGEGVSGLFMVVGSMPIRVVVWSIWA